MRLHNCRILQKLLSKDQSHRLQTWDQESIRKISNWVEANASAQSSLWKYFFGNSNQKLHIVDVGL